jgi:hypothetical protein
MPKLDAEYIERRINKAIQSLENLDYVGVNITAKDFITWMTADKFAEDKITVFDVLESDNLMVHEVVEINEVKKNNIELNKRVLLDTPRVIIYESHILALKIELEYILQIYRDRVKDLEQIVINDPYAPDAMKQKATTLLTYFKTKKM